MTSCTAHDGSSNSCLYRAYANAWISQCTSFQGTVCNWFFRFPWSSHFCHKCPSQQTPSICSLLLPSPHLQHHQLIITLDSARLSSGVISPHWFDAELDFNSQEKALCLCYLSCARPTSLPRRLYSYQQRSCKFQPSRTTKNGNLPRSLYSGGGVAKVLRDKQFTDQAPFASKSSSHSSPRLTQPPSYDDPSFCTPSVSTFKGWIPGRSRSWSQGSSRIIEKTFQVISPLAPQQVLPSPTGMIWSYFCAPTSTCTTRTFIHGMSN